MNEHLSARQIDEWLIGERVPEVAAHLERCIVCAEEVRSFSVSLGQFGQAVRETSAGDRSLFRKQEAFRRPALLFALAALVAIIAVVLYRGERTRSQSAKDEILLQQVESHIAQSVPTPMEPLAKLMRQELE